MNYKEYLQSDYWKKRRLEFISKTWKRCFLCRGVKNLEVHHKRYFRKGKSILFRERHTDLRLLCRSCHQGIHDLKLEKVLAGNLMKRIKIVDLLHNKV